MATFTLDKFITADEVSTDIKAASSAGLFASAWGIARNSAQAGNVAAIGLKTTTIGAVVKSLDSIEDSIMGNSEA